MLNLPNRADMLSLIEICADTASSNNLRNFFIHAQNSFLFILLCPLLRILPYKKDGVRGDLTK